MNKQLQELVNYLNTWHLQDKGRKLVSRPYPCTFTTQHEPVNMVLLYQFGKTVDNFEVQLRSIPVNDVMVSEVFTLDPNTANIIDQPYIITQLVTDLMKDRRYYLKYI